MPEHGLQPSEGVGGGTGIEVEGVGAGVAPATLVTREDGLFWVTSTVSIITGSSPREGVACQDTQ